MKIAMFRKIKKGLHEYELTWQTEPYINLSLSLIKNMSSPFLNIHHYYRYFQYHCCYYYRHFH